MNKPHVNITELFLKNVVNAYNHADKSLIINVNVEDSDSPGFAITGYGQMNQGFGYRMHLGGDSVLVEDLEDNLFFNNGDIESITESSGFDDFKGYMDRSFVCYLVEWALNHQVLITIDYSSSYEIVSDDFGSQVNYELQLYGRWKDELSTYKTYDLITIDSYFGFPSMKGDVNEICFTDQANKFFSESALS